MFAKGQTVIQFLEQLAPKHYAMPDDKIGLQLGTLHKEIKKVMIALDVVDAVVDEAIEQEVDLIIAHHAIIYRPLLNIQTDTPAGRLYEKLIKHDIAVYIAHTNLDVAEGGINDMMAEAIGLTDLKLLTETQTELLKKLIVYVPEDYQLLVQQAMFNAGAGTMGQYSHCSFTSAGTGSFLAEAEAEPFIGKIGKIERVTEMRLETIVPARLERKVIQAMLKSHPYEEVAYDLYTLDRIGRTFGLGRVGKLPDQILLEDLAEKVKSAFEVPRVRVVGDLQRSISKVAVLGGAGSHYLKQAYFAGADVLITGDIDYHSAQDALANGLAIIDPGHNVEKIMKTHISSYMEKQLLKYKYATVVISSGVNTEVFQFV